MEWDLVLYMEVGFRKAHVSPLNLSFCLYSANFNVYNKATLELFFVARVFVKRLCV
jgi:hypothetical protein